MNTGSNEPQKPIRLLMSGSDYFNRQTREVALYADYWRVTQLDRSRIPFRPLAALVLLNYLLGSDLWYQSYGIHAWYGEVFTRTAVALGVPQVIHWVGDDVLSAGPYLKGRPRFLKFLQGAGGISHWATAPWLVGELEQIGIEAEFVPFTSRKRKRYLLMEPPDFPEQFTVLTSIPEQHPRFYGWEHILRLAEDFPEITVKVVRAGGGFSDRKPANLHFAGWVDDMFNVYANSTVAVRMTEHDGLSGSIQEPLALGRYAVWTYPFPGALLAKDYPTLHNHITGLLNLHRQGLLKHNQAGRRYIKENLDPQVLAENLERKLRQCANTIKNKL